tara:strand:- start:1477 stop:1860 length:384 start_codon:yes stop_codon:yes gene_type:complete
MTKNFKIKEFNCKCGCEMPSEVLINITKLANQLQAVRDFTSYPIIINSAYRCEDHNNAIGSNSSSQHILGKAADIVIFGLDPVIDTYPLLEDLILSGFILQGGLGMYNSFTHYDIRKTKARWNNAKL